jgi:hypothetical protein
MSVKAKMPCVPELAIECFFPQESESTRGAARTVVEGAMIVFAAVALDAHGGRPSNESVTWSHGEPADCRDAEEIPQSKNSKW